MSREIKERRLSQRLSQPQEIQINGDKGEKKKRGDGTRERGEMVTVVIWENVGKEKDA